MTHVAIMIGGAAGAAARHGVSAVAAVCCAPALPWGTLAVNVSGSWTLGLLMAVLPASNVPPALRAGLTIGFCGGFTTFSTFSLEAVMLLRQDQIALAVLYVSASVGISAAGVLAGVQTGAWLMRVARTRSAFSRPKARDSSAAAHPPLIHSPEDPP